MNDTKAKVLIGIADKELSDLWSKSPAVIGSDGWGVTIGSREAGTAYVMIAQEWMAEANSALAQFDPEDPNPVIDQLGARLDVVIQRRNTLFGMGMGLSDSLSDGMRTFVKEVIARAKRVYQEATNPRNWLIGAVGAVLILVAVIMAKR